MRKNNLIKPQRLCPGDTIGIVSPAGAVKENKLWEPTVRYFENKGYKVKVAPNARSHKAYLAGDDEGRLADLMGFFEDSEMKAIICSRGGYGTFRLLKRIDFDLIRRNPKILVGYSDITALLLAFAEKAGLITFHGPLALSDFGVDRVNKFTESSFFDILEGNVSLPYSYPNPCSYECIKSGEAEGVLFGGNLAIITGLLGTSYFPDLTGRILLLEDIGEPLYRIDRMLMQLKLAGVFEKISGLLFGEFSSIVQSDNPEVNSLTAIDVIKELTEDIDIPIGYGFPASHEACKVTIPMGVEYYFNSGDFTLQLREQYVVQ